MRANHTEPTCTLFYRCIALRELIEHGRIALSEIPGEIEYLIDRIRSLEALSDFLSIQLESLADSLAPVGGVSLLSFQQALYVIAIRHADKRRSITDLVHKLVNVVERYSIKYALYYALAFFDSALLYGLVSRYLFANKISTSVITLRSVLASDEFKIAALKQYMPLVLIAIGICLFKCAKEEADVGEFAEELLADGFAQLKEIELELALTFHRTIFRWIGNPGNYVSPQLAEKLLSCIIANGGHDYPDSQILNEHSKVCLLILEQDISCLEEQVAYAANHDYGPLLSNYIAAAIRYYTVIGQEGGQSHGYFSCMQRLLLPAQNPLRQIDWLMLESAISQNEKSRFGRVTILRMFFFVMSYVKAKSLNLWTFKHQNDFMRLHNRLQQHLVCNLPDVLAGGLKQQMDLKEQTIQSQKWKITKLIQQNLEQGEKVQSLLREIDNLKRRAQKGCQETTEPPKKRRKTQARTSATESEVSNSGDDTLSSAIDVSSPVFLPTAGLPTYLPLSFLFEESEVLDPVGESQLSFEPSL